MPCWSSKGVCTGGWWPNDPMPPIKCWQRWAQNMLPFLSIASGDTMATRWKKLGPSRHSTHALASIVERLKFSVSVFFRAEITERALMWNMRLLPPFISSVFSLFFPSSSSRRHPLHCYGSECTALIIPWLLCFKGLAARYNFPNAHSLNLNFWLHQTDCCSSLQNH